VSKITTINNTDTSTASDQQQPEQASEAAKDASGEAAVDASREQALATELELVGLLRENTDIFSRHPELLVDMCVPHPSGAAASLIERQVDVLRQKLKLSDQRLCDLMDVARDNERLSNARHELAVSLFAAADLEDVISIVLDLLRDELSADYAVIKLLTHGDHQQGDQQSGSEQAAAIQPDDRYLDSKMPAMSNFKTIFEQRSVICGKPSEQQKQLLFGDDADNVRSAAVIPLAAGSNIGLIGLGSKKAARFTSSMGVDFLGQIGELVSAAIIRHH